MRWAVVALNYRSIEEARKLRDCYKISESELLCKTDELSENMAIPVIDIYTIDKYMEDDLELLSGGLRHYNEILFEDYKVIIYVMAMGIIVRDIAPYLKHKSVDPAVLCLSVDGSYIIPVISGHLGGANELAFEINEKIGAVPIITTASDVLGKSAVDVIAKANDLVITSFKTAKDLTAMMINNEKVAIVCDDGIKIETDGSLEIYDSVPPSAEGVIYIGSKKKLDTHLPVARLIRKQLVIGVGARRGTSMGQLTSFLEEVFEAYNLDVKGVKSMASIDLKAEEDGIIQLAKQLKVPFDTYTAEELSVVVDRFDQSEFVRSITGVGAVAMPSGCLASEEGTCLVNKVAKNGMTLCVWRSKK